MLEVAGPVALHLLRRVSLVELHNRRDIELRRNRHIVAVGNAIIRIETLIHRHELRLMPQVPLAHDARGIALPLQQFSDGEFRRRQARS